MKETMLRCGWIFMEKMTSCALPGDLGTQILACQKSQGWFQALRRIANKAHEGDKARQWLNLAVASRITKGGKGTSKTANYCPINAERVLRWLNGVELDGYWATNQKTPRELTTDELQRLQLQFTSFRLLEPCSRSQGKPANPKTK